MVFILRRGPEHLDGLVQHCSIPSVLTMDVCSFFTKPSIYSHFFVEYWLSYNETIVLSINSFVCFHYSIFSNADFFTLHGLQSLVK